MKLFFATSPCGVVYLSQARGHELVFRFAETTGSDVALKLYGERRFDNLILLAQTLSGNAEKGKETSEVLVADVMGFIEDGGRLLLGWTGDILFGLVLSDGSSINSLLSLGFCF